MWNKKLHSALQDLGFNRIRSDPSLYVYERGEVRIYMPVYVDDITIVSRSQPAIVEVVIFPLQFHLFLMGTLVTV